MAKKYKRSVSQSQASTSTSTAGSQTAVKSASSFTRRSAVVEFNPDYNYVLSDLKRIAVMSVSFIALLIILHFALPAILQLFQH